MKTVKIDALRPLLKADNDLKEAVLEFCSSFDEDDINEEVASQAHFYKKIFVHLLEKK